jgi:hypothetical protein
MSELVSRDGTNISVALKMKFDSKKLLKDVPVGTSVEWWTKAVCRKVQRTSKDRTISILPMQMIFDDRTWAFGGNGWFRYGDCHLAIIILIEVSVLTTVTQRVLRSVEGFPDEQTNRTWVRRRGRLQCDRFDGRRAG